VTTTTVFDYTAQGTSELAKALVKAQSEFPTIERSKTVSVTTKTGGKYTFDYAPLDAIVRAVSGPLTANGLAFSQLLTHVGGQLALRTVLLHSSGEKLEGTCPLPLNGESTPQEIGSLVTYMRRYALVALLGIATEEDDDGNTASGSVANPAAGRGAGEPDSGSAADALEEAHAAYLRRIEKGRAPGAVPSEQVIHFGRNKGLTLGELTPRQLAWYATEWKLQDEPTEYDHRLKAAAVALNAGHDHPDFDPPF
jgi:hypothetical protein